MSQCDDDVTQPGSCCGVTLLQRNEHWSVGRLLWRIGKRGLINFPDAVANELQQKLFSGNVA
jgi:hypothetical protein